MYIDQTQIKGCDHLSLIYGEMFNVLQDIMNDKEKLHGLSPLDYSALGIYMGKFAEQEINSSIVQLMRAYRGILMPEFYCLRDPKYGKGEVHTTHNTVRLNSQKYHSSDPEELQTIPLGDAFYALEELLEEDQEGFFDDYPWLQDKIFQEAWRKLGGIRNKMAHSGLLIDNEVLEDNYAYFSRFLQFMPQIIELKQKLMPANYAEPVSNNTNSYWVTTNNHDRQSVIEAACQMDDTDVCYPGFDPKSEIIERKGKFVLVDSEGHDMSEECDEIMPINDNDPYMPYVFRKNGLLSWGLMEVNGNVLCDCVIDRYREGNGGTLWFEVDGLLGLWNIDYYLEPIYENIEMPATPYEPLLFTLDGEQGYVRYDDFSFVPLSEFEQMSKDEKEEVSSDFISEELY